MELLEFVIKIGVIAYVIYYLATHKIIVNLGKESVEAAKESNKNASVLMSFDGNENIKMNILAEKS